MSKLPSLTFSLRGFAAFVTVIAVLCAAKQVFWVCVVLVVAAVHGLLLVAGVQLAKRFPGREREGAVRRLSRPLFPDLSFVPSIPVLAAAGCLAIFGTWHMLLLCHLQFPAFLDVWYTPFLPGIALYHVHTATLVAANVFTVGSFLAGCYGTGIVRPSECLMTACASALLFYAHFAYPAS